MKKLLLIQPGAFGDLFVCAPIAKWYADRGYEVHWPVTEKFLPIVKSFDYVKPILLPDDSLHPDWLRSDIMKILPLVDQYDKVVNLADRGPHPTAQRPEENFELCKYRLAEVPFEEKNKLVWTRNLEKEGALYEHLNIKGPYAVVHTEDSLGQKADLPSISHQIIEIKKLQDYNIQDWFLVLSNAQEIYCVESAPHQFMDGICDKLTEKRFLLKRPAVAEGCRFTVSNSWNLKYIGENSILRG